MEDISIEDYTLSVLSNFGKMHWNIFNDLWFKADTMRHIGLEYQLKKINWTSIIESLKNLIFFF